MNTVGGSLSEKTTSRQILLLLQPSWLSGAVCVLTGLVIVVGTIVLAQYRGNLLGQEFLPWRNLAPDSSYAATFNTLYASGRFQMVTGEVATVVLWAFVGLFAYCLTYGIYDTFWHVRAFNDELHYVHVRRRQLIYDTALHVGMQLLASGMWLAYALLFLRAVIPGVFAAVGVAATQPMSLYGLVLACGSFVTLVTTLHLHAVFCRLVLLRPRLFE